MSDETVSPQTGPPGGRPPVVMRLPATADSLTVARQVVTGVALAAGMSGEPVEDVKIAVTEACTNAARHAYDDGPLGQMEVSAWIDGDRLVVTVCDDGGGLAGQPDTESPTGVGLVTIRALARDVVLRERPGGGAEIVMSFDIRRDGPSPG